MVGAKLLPWLSLLSVPALAFRPLIVPIGGFKNGSTAILGGPAETLTTTAAPATTTVAAAGTAIPRPKKTSSASGSTPTKTALPACQSVQYAFRPGEGGDAARAAAVVEAYEYAFNAYVEYAWDYDELTPLSMGGQNDWYGWGVTVVDGLDTAIIMNLTSIVTKILTRIQTVDFSTTAYGDVEMFDVTIRYLGGLLSSYDLLKSGEFYNGYDPDLVDALLSQAVVLADKLAYGFGTETGISAAYVDFSTNTPVESTYTDPSGTTWPSTNTASSGTYLLEWYRLAALTGNTTYRELVDKGEYYLTHPSPAPIYPGLVGSQFATSTGAMLNQAGGWHSTIDSFLEYLVKSYHYQADNITTGYADFWLEATNSTVAHLAVHPYGFPDLTFISELDDYGNLTYSMDDYTCFAGGNYLLGCKVLGVPELCDLGVAAADGCHQTYNTTATGLGSLYWAWYDAQTNTYPPDSTVDVDNGYRRNGAQNGFFIADGDEVYGSFPESIESWFYAYRVTGETRWADYVWEVFGSLNTTARNSVAFATVNNVAMPWGGSQSDSLDSFFFAEVLKYIYLTFADPSVVDLGRWVFNTECHPMLVQCGNGNVDNY